MNLYGFVLDTQNDLLLWDGGRTAMRYDSSEKGLGSCGKAAGHSWRAGATMDEVKLRVKA